MADQGELVVNADHLMSFVNEQREEGNRAYKAGRHSEALQAWQSGLDALAQADGKPMHAADVATVLHARSLLHSNRGQALITMEFWRRALKDLAEAVRIDPTNAKALWRSYQAHRQLKEWAEAERALEALRAPELKEAAGPLLAAAGLDEEKLASTLQELRRLRADADAAAAASFEERAEEAAAKGLTQLRERFEEVTRRNGLHGNDELSTELAGMLTRDGGVSVEHVAATYQIDEEDALVLMQWAQKACVMRDALGHRGLV